MLDVSETKCFVSFIIPAKNEELFLPRTIQRIHDQAGGNISYEVLVIDNGSTDDTARLAEALGAKVLSKKTGSIGALRNFGVQNAKGGLIVFIDADVLLGDEWFEAFVVVISEFQDHAKLITGSRCRPPEDAGWIAKTWFWESPAAKQQITHVATGHMITSKSLFQELGGFDERLVSAEDFEFCDRAKRVGAKVRLNADLVAYHNGMPVTLYEFFKREIWHGAGDLTTFGLALSSKVVILTVIFLLAHFGILLAALVFNSLFMALSMALLAITICIVSSVKKYHSAPLFVQMANAALFYVYYSGRSVSLINRLIGGRVSTSPRTGRPNSV